MGYDARTRLEVEEARRSEVIERQQRAAEQLVEDKRQIRERRALENTKRLSALAEKRRERIAAHTRREQGRIQVMDVCTAEKYRSTTHCRSLNDDCSDSLALMHEAVMNQDKLGTCDNDALWKLVDVLTEEGPQGVAAVR